MPGVPGILEKLAGLAGKARSVTTPAIESALGSAKNFRPSLGGTLEGLTGIGKGLPGRWNAASPTMKGMIGLDVLGGGAILGGMGYDLAKGGYDSLRDLSGEPFKARVNEEFGSRASMLGVRMQAERRARELAVNAQRLAQFNPNLYNQIMAGRTLPRGAIVIGGQPRTDLLEDFARQMADDARTGQPETAEQEYMRLLSS